MWSCKDGWINFIIYGGAAGRHTNQQLSAWMEEKGMAPAWFKDTDWSTFAVTSITQKEVDRLEIPIAEFFSTITKQEFLAGAMERKILGYPVATVDDIHKDPRLQARQFWQEVAIPHTGATLKYAGGFAIFNDRRLQIRWPRPPALANTIALSMRMISVYLVARSTSFRLMALFNQYDFLKEVLWQGR
jgi:crotonobetainyl-CoA:carnitine CoA-transferase CaiB-like acyl-CoA transferase